MKSQHRSCFSHGYVQYVEKIRTAGLWIVMECHFPVYRAAIEMYGKHIQVKTKIIIN